MPTRVENIAKYRLEEPLPRCRIILNENERPRAKYKCWRGCAYFDDFDNPPCRTPGWTQSRDIWLDSIDLFVIWWAMNSEPINYHQCNFSY
jgi:hypothetical protein